ncbi:MAG: hypothetical protein KKB62_02855 [Nanoarchaeota archaeon]|nr:hypothetical protein [Nanoarchaeota archaeon]
MYNKINSRGQVGETLTWIIATVIILVLVLFFIFGASLLASTKSISSEFRPSLSLTGHFIGTDPFLKKSLFTYVTLPSESKKIILDREFQRLLSQEGFAIDFNETKKEIILRYNRR